MPIVLYTSKRCLHCEEAKTYTKRVADELGEEFIHIDMEEEPGGVPVTVVPVVCYATKSGEELKIKSCTQPGLFSIEEVRKFIQSQKEKE